MARARLTLLSVAALALLGCEQSRGQLPPDKNSVASACMRATACQVKPFARVEGCMFDYLELRLRYGEAAVMGHVLECVNHADTCAEVADCFGAGEPCNSSFAAHCDGDTAVYCDLMDGRTYRYDCGSVGAACHVDGSAPYYASCMPATASNATGLSLSFDLRCDGNFCDRTGEPCSSDDLDQCSGEDIVACVDGEIVLFNCKSIGLRTCIMEENDWGHCRPQIE